MDSLCLVLSIKGELKLITCDCLKEVSVLELLRFRANVHRLSSVLLFVSNDRATMRLDCDSLCHCVD